MFVRYLVTSTPADTPSEFYWPSCIVTSCLSWIQEPRRLRPDYTHHRDKACYGVHPCAILLNPASFLTSPAETRSKIWFCASAQKCEVTINTRSHRQYRHPPYPRHPYLQSPGSYTSQQLRTNSWNLLVSCHRAVE